MILGNTQLYRSASISPVIETVDINQSLFVESLDMLRESDRFFNETFKNLHISLLLSESSQKNTTYLQEFSFGELIKNIIDFFIEAIKKLFNKFKDIFHKITYNDKTIDKYSTKLKNMTGEFTVNFPRYIYTCFDEDTPSINLKTTFYDDYSTLEEKMKEIANLKTKTERCERMRIIEADVNSEVSPAYYDTLRQRTINTTYMISSHDFASELFNRFRDGGKQTTSKITPTEVTNTLNRYQNHKTLMKQIEKAKQDTIDAAKEVEKKIQNFSLQKINKSYVPYDVEEEVLFSNITRTKSGQVNEACNIFTMAFAAKLDAIKESVIQDKKVLFDAIKYINSMGGGI